MQIEIKHNPTEYFRLSLLNWSLIWKKKIKSQILIMVIGAMFITISYADKNNYFLTDDYLFAMGVFLLIVPINFLWAAYKSRKRYITILTERSRRLIEKYIYFEFNDVGISYKDEEHSQFITWILISEFRLYEGIIMIKLKGNEAYSFLLSENEIGKEKSKELVDLLRSKIIK